jgi:hypothetical protein
MEQLPIRYILEIIHDAHEWQNKGLLHELEKGKGGKKNYFRPLKLFVLVVALVMTVIFNEGIDKEFAGYIIAALSIFIGLNINLIIMVFDKFNTTNFNVTNKPYIERVRLLKRRNFFMQYTSLTAYSIILSIILILFLSLCFSAYYSISISITDCFQYYMDLVILDIPLVWSWEAFKSVLYLVSVLFFRCLTYYLLLYYLLILSYSIGSIYAYISQEFKNKKIEVYPGQNF